MRVSYYNELIVSMECISIQTIVAESWWDGRKVVGLPGFEPGSIGPKPTSIDQTNPQALITKRIEMFQELC